MKNNAKRVLCLLLAITMLASLGVCAFADDTQKHYDYDKYMSIGDSIAAGCALTKDGSETYFDQNSDNYAYVYSEQYIYLGHNYAVVPKAYHSLVANALGAELLQCARSGMRGVELRYWLDGVYNDYDETCSWDNTYFDVDGNGFTISDLDAFNAYINYPEKVKEADIISINIGSNDVFSFTFGVVLKQLTADSSDPTLTAIKEYFEKTGNLGAAFGKLIDAYQTMGKTTELITVLTSTFNTTYKQYENNYNAIMSKIFELNPGVTVVNVGVFNPLRYVRFSSENETDISFVMQGIVSKMNNLLKVYQKKYDNCFYADVTDTETYYQCYEDPLFWQYFTLKVHPTIAGHQYMAQQIMNVVPEADHNYKDGVCTVCGEIDPDFTPAVPAPTISIKTENGKPTMSWPAVDGAVKYDVYRATSKTGTYNKYYTTTNTSYTNTSAVPGTTYYYKVKAVAANGKTSDFSAIKYITCDCAAPVATISTSASSGKPTLKWNAVDGATKYEIWRATSSNGEYVKYYTTTKTSYTNTSAVAGNTYYYKVKAICDKSSYGDSAFSAVKYITCDCAQPVVSITTSSGHPKLSWKAVDGADKYVIYRATSSNGTFNKYDTTSKTTYTNTSATAGTTYYYKVVAVSDNSTYADSAYSTVVSIKAK